MIKNGVDGTMIEGLGEPYDVPMNLSAHMAKANVPVLWWRSVGSTHTAFVMETLIDEAAHAAGQDPVAYRKKLIDAAKHPRHHRGAGPGGGQVRLRQEDPAEGPCLGRGGARVLQHRGRLRGRGLDRKDGTPKLHKATAAVHCNLAVNPLTIEAQVQGAALMGLGTTLPGARITLKDGVVEQQNFSDYRWRAWSTCRRSRCTSCPRPIRRPAWANRACRRWRRPSPTRCSS